MIRVRWVIAVILVSTAGILGATTSAWADVAGQNVTFFTDPTFDVQGASKVTATLRLVSQDGYFYVDDRYWDQLTGNQRSQFSLALDQLGAAFDSQIYPGATAFWGSEAKPGVDGDPHVTVLLENLGTGNGGYFETINNYSKSLAPQSNQREMIYVNTSSIFANTAKIFIAHEFQHLISFNQKELIQNISDDVWLNEARSEYDITVVGYNDPFSGSSLQRRVQTFLRTPSDSLVEWPNTSTDYGIAAVFAEYLADRFGPPLMASTIHSSDNGVMAVNDWLVQNGSEDFRRAFTDWMVASYLNDPSLDPGYAYTRAGLSTIHVQPQQEVSVSGTSSATLQANITEWQPVWLRFAIVSPGTAPALNLQIGGQEQDMWSGATIATYADGSHAVAPFYAPAGSVLSVSASQHNTALTSVALALTQGIYTPVNNHPISTFPVSITATLGQAASAPAPISGQLINGDLIRHDSQSEIYVVWGPYRRLLLPGILALYGFENRPVISVDDTTFARYTTSNYIRAIDGYKVYAVWPDGTKHWLNITAQQWDASGRDWGAIFVVNDAEVNFYATGADITR